MAREYRFDANRSNGGDFVTITEILGNGTLAGVMACASMLVAIYLVFSYPGVIGPGAGSETG